VFDWHGFAESSFAPTTVLLLEVRDVNRFGSTLKLCLPRGEG